MSICIYYVLLLLYENIDTDRTILLWSEQNCRIYNLSKIIVYCKKIYTQAKTAQE